MPKMILAKYWVAELLEEHEIRLLQLLGLLDEDDLCGIDLQPGLDDREHLLVRGPVRDEHA